MSGNNLIQESVASLERLMIAGLTLRGVPSEDAEFIAHDFLEAELTSRPTHGLLRFLLLDAALATPSGRSPKITRRGPRATVNGHRNLGHIVMRVATETAIELAERHGIGMVTARDFSRFSRLVPYGRAIAERAQVGMIWASAGPPCVAPYGTTAPLLGSNPVCVSLPGDPDPLVIDVSTAKHVWGEVRQAILLGRPLPNDAFFDSAGQVTTDPSSAEAVQAFGGMKGAALCAAIELFVGCLSDVPVCNDVADEFSLGAVVLAATPSARPPGAPVSALLDGLRSLTTASDQQASPRPPGSSALVRARDHRDAPIQLARWTLDALRAFSIGERIPLDRTDKRMN